MCIIFIVFEMDSLSQEFQMIKISLKSYFWKSSTGCGRGTTRFLKCFMLATLEDKMAEIMSFTSLTDATAVAMEQWSTHHAYVLKPFFKNDDYVVKMQWIFCMCFSIAHHGKVPCHNTIQLWVECFWIKKETTRQCVYSVIATEYWGCAAVIHKEF
jgi:hypothetical protein